MARFRRRRSVTEPPPPVAPRTDAAPRPDPAHGPPARFNFTRDVVESLAATPLRPALTYVSRDGVIDRQTFADVASDASRWANLLRARGVEHGDRILVHVGRVPGWHAILLGALKIGAVAVPCSEMLRARDLSFRATHSQARLLVSQRRAEQQVAAMEPQLATIYLEDARDELRECPASAVPADTGADDPALILYTSGTTKDPRGVVHTHAYTWAARLQAQSWLDAGERDLVWCTAGTGWAKAIWNVLLGPWSCGAEVVVHDGAAFDPVERFDLLARLGVSILCQSPTEYRLMAKVDGIDVVELPHLRHAVSAGEPLNPEVIKIFSDAFGLTIHDGYGQTENTLLVANAHGSEIRPGSMGRPTPGHVVHVIDERGDRVAPGVEGDIALLGRPPSLFTRYWNDAQATQDVFRGEYYVTGDRATVDADGYLWFTGRADDVILSAAYRIGPFEVESALLEHPAVAESGVIGKPDADRGQVVKAFVVLRPGIESSDALADELREHVKAVTAPYKAPREVEFVSSLPKTASGKIRRVELRARALQAVPAPTTPAIQEPPVADELARARAQRQREEDAALAEEARDGAARMAAAQREAELQEAARHAAEQADAARREAERATAARIEAERAEAERREAAELAAAMLAAERAETERLERERREAERIAAERRETERIEAERREAERREAERVAAERREAERIEAERREAERREAERLETERLAAERREAARVAAERAEAERRDAERQEAMRLKAERQEAARREVERVEAERRATERAEAARLEAERREAERVEAERREAARREAERREAAHIEAELAEVRRQEAERRAARHVAEEQRDAEMIATKRAQAEKMRTARLRTEQRNLEERNAETSRVGTQAKDDPAPGGSVQPSSGDEHDREADESLIARLRAYRMHDDDSPGTE